ncbi:MAG: hypothetical protein AAGA87_17300 [Pseudomonadota bacterium]
MTGTLFLLFTAIGMALAVLATAVAGLTSFSVWTPVAVVTLLTLLTIALLTRPERGRVRSRD